ncbi:hypothetical protein C1S65_07090 [Pseudomonas putida]|uniref:Uncharacterized protein n=1 Tax=Pseudomonas putida TaxID=303 RepID=A0AAD0L6V9_PSEPU|nr:hypothetical protein C1S65_07090 [Pseudomonas putida]
MLRLAIVVIPIQIFDKDRGIGCPSTGDRTVAGVDRDASKRHRRGVDAEHAHNEYPRLSRSK